MFSWFRGDVLAKLGCEGSLRVGGSNGMGSGSLVVAQRGCCGSLGDEMTHKRLLSRVEIYVAKRRLNWFIGDVMLSWEFGGSHIRAIDYEA
jgi:hypothetical protein